MTMSKARLAAMLLTASAVGAGAGWLSHSRVTAPSAARSQLTTAPAISPPAAAHDELKEILLTVLAERRKESPPRESKPLPTVGDKGAARYQGKPASEWLALFRDRDPDTRKKAIDPLAAIAEVDRTILPILIEGLKDKEEDIQKAIAGHLADLKPPIRETVLLLVQGKLELSTLLDTLRALDPKGEVVVPLARSTLQDKKLGLRAGFLLLAYDKDASLPIPLLVQALGKSDNTIYAVDGKDNEQWCSQRVLAAWQLRRLGREVPSAVPKLVDALCYSGEWDSWGRRMDRPGPFSVLNLHNEVDCFAATLTSVDPEGKQAIPLLLKMLGNREYSQELRCNAARALGHYGKKAKSAAAALRDLLKDKEALKQKIVLTSASIGSPGIMGESEATRALQEAITDTLGKIAPTKEPPSAPR
jgi:DNA-directed RNA polymerase subunit F